MANSGGGGGGSAEGIRAGRAYVEIGTNNKGLNDGLKAAEKRLEKFGSTVFGAGLKLAGGGVAALGGLGALANEFIERGDKIKKASDRIGDSAENVSLLGYAASQSGTDLEGLETGIGKLQKALVEAAEKGGEAAAGFQDIGINAAELVNKSPTEQLFAIGDALEHIENPAKRSSAAVAALGRGGRELIPLLKDGTKGLKALMEEGLLAGALVTTEEAEATEKLGDSIQRTFTAGKYTVQSFFKALVPHTASIEELSFAVLRTLKTVREWVGENRALVATVVGVSAAAVAGGGVLIGLGIASKLAAAGLGLLGTTLSITWGILAFAATPAGLVLGILGGLAVAIGYLLATTEAGQGVLQFFANGWKELADIFGDAWGGINDALASGDLEAAGNIAMAGLTAAWLQFTANLRKIWDDFTNHFVQGWKSAALLVRTELIKLREDEVDILKFIGRQTGVGGFVDFMGAGVKGQVAAELKTAFAESDIKAGGAAKSPEVIKAEKAAADARAKLDELIGAAALNRIILDEERAGKAAALGSLGGAGALSRGTFGTRGFASQAFGGGGQPLTELVQLQRGNNQKLNDIDLHLQEIAKKGLVLT